MTLHKEDTTSDVDPVQFWSVKDLEAEFASLLNTFKDKETEFNWVPRDKSITRLRGIIRGNATEPPYLDTFTQCMRHMVDGVIKAVESLRTQLAVNALSLVSDIGYYVGKHLDAYVIDQLLLCMIRCASLTKKMVATASLTATKTFLKYTHFYPKFMNMLNYSMADKNIQVRLYALTYTKVVLETHAHIEKSRVLMDRANCLEHFENIISKGLNDASPLVKEVSREAFWIFWEYWRDRGDYILRQLPAIQQKQLEKSKLIIQAANNSNGRNSQSPTISPRASSSLGRHNMAISPSNSTNSIGSGSGDHHPSIKRSMSPRAVSPHLRSTYASPPPSSISSQLQLPPSSTSPTPTTGQRKTRVPLTRKKSAIGLSKKKPTANFLTLLKSDDPFLRNEGLGLLAKKLEAIPYTSNVVPSSIQLDVPNGPPVDGETVKSIIFNLWDECYDILSSWDGLTCIIMRLFTFEEYIPKLILDATAEESARKTESDIAKLQYANLALTRAKLFLAFQNPDLVDTLFTSLYQYGGFVIIDSRNKSSSMSVKRDITRLPANRRKLTKILLEWLDELVTPLIGLNEDVDYTAKAYEGVPSEYLDINNCTATTSEWFESDENVHNCLAILLPAITKSTSGTMWHAPLVTFMKHIRLLNQRLFEKVTATYDEYSTNKICRVLGIHIRLEPPTVVVPSLDTTKQEDLSYKLEDDLVPFERSDTIKEEEEPEEEVVRQTQSLAVPINFDDFDQAVSDQAEYDLSVDHLEANRLSVIEPPVADDEVLFEDPPFVLAPPSNKPLLDKLDAQEKEVPPNDNPYVPQSYVEPEKKAEIIQEKPVEVVKSRGIVSSRAVETITREAQPSLYKPEPEPEFYQQPTETKPVVKEETSQTYKEQPSIQPSAALEHNLHDHHPTVPHFTEPNYTSSPTSPPVHHISPLSPSTQHSTVPNGQFSPRLQNGQLSPQVHPSTLSPHMPLSPPVQLDPPVLPVSYPNPKKFPEPKYVPFFAPERVNFPLPIFARNVRTNLTMTHSTSTNTNGTTARNLKDKTILLYALIDKLKAPSQDHQNTFRKLSRLFKDIPIRRRWDQGGIEENGSETWAGAQGDAGNFVETVQAILPYLEDRDVNQKAMLSALECIRQLAITQAGLFRFFERKVDEKGRSLESQIMEKLLIIRSNENPTICIAAEDALDALLGTLNPPTAFEMLMAFIIYRSFIAPNDGTSLDVRYHPLGTAFTYLGKWVKEINDKFYIDEWLGKGGVNAFFKGVNHTLISIRKACVDAIVAFHEVIGDDIYLFLGDLREDQLNLIRHYVAKALKKKRLVFGETTTKF